VFLFFDFVICFFFSRIFSLCSKTPEDIYNANKALVQGLLALLQKEGVPITPENAREFLGGAPVQLLPEMVLFTSEHEITDEHMMKHLEGEQMQQYLKERVCRFDLFSFHFLCEDHYFFYSLSI
jgi:hypothetical protein